MRNGPQGEESGRPGASRPIGPDLYAGLFTDLVLQTLRPSLRSNRMSVALIALSAGLLYGQSTPRLTAWTALALLNVVLYEVGNRWCTGLALRGAWCPRASAVLLSLSLLGGLTWGAIVLVPQLDASHPTDQAAAAGLVLMVMSANLVFSSASRAAFAVFHVSLVATGATGFLVAHDPHLAVLLVFAGLASVGLHQELHRHVIESTVLARRNQRMAEQLEAANADLAERATRDPLTKLANRDVFRTRIREVTKGRREGGPLPGVVYFDIDHFKSVNDTYGHAAGDLLLQQVAARLTERVEEHELLARLGGDEFVLLLDDGRAGRALEAAGRVLDAFAAPFTLDEDVTQRFTASVGVAVADLTCTYAELVARADSALYGAKALGRDRVQDWESLQAERETARTAQRTS